MLTTSPSSSRIAIDHQRAHARTADYERTPHIVGRSCIGNGISLWAPASTIAAERDADTAMPIARLANRRSSSSLPSPSSVRPGLDTLPFDVSRDIAPVAGLINFPFVMLVRPSFPAATVAEFIAYARANPGKIRTASFGTGTTSHLACEWFKKMAGVDMIHVPYRASAAAHIDLIAERVDAMFDTLTAPLPHIRSGALRAARSRHGGYGAIWGTA